MTDPRPPAGLSDAALELLDAIAHRADAAARIEPPGGAAVLRSVVDATVRLFDAEAASIALYDPATDQLVFRVAAGAQGQGVVGVAIAPHEGVAGYVYSTGQPIAIADVASDPRFGSGAAERTGYVPRSLLAVPLMDDDETLGVLEILDRREVGPFDLREIELASVFAQQATVAIRATRLERDTAALLGEALRGLATSDPSGGAEPGRVIDEIVTAAVERLTGDDGTPVWALADRVARLRAADPEQVGLLVELLDVLVARGERRRVGRGLPGGHQQAGRSGDPSSSDA